MADAAWSSTTSHRIFFLILVDGSKLFRRPKRTPHSIRPRQSKRARVRDALQKANRSKPYTDRGPPAPARRRPGPVSGLTTPLPRSHSNARSNLSPAAVTSSIAALPTNPGRIAIRSCRRVLLGNDQTRPPCRAQYHDYPPGQLVRRQTSSAVCALLHLPNYTRLHQATRYR